MPDAYFTTKDGMWFAPSDHARGPWDVDACHAGPPVALMVRAVEKLVPSQQLVRLTVELICPIPMAGFRVQGEVRRPGRSVTHTEAEIFDEDRIIARAYGMHFRVLDTFEAEAQKATPLRFRTRWPVRSPSRDTCTTSDGSAHRLRADTIRGVKSLPVDRRPCGCDPCIRSSGARNHRPSRGSHPSPIVATGYLSTVTSQPHPS